LSDDVTVYLVDRAGAAANAFGAKLEGRQGVQLVGGSDNIDEALEDIGASALDVILVGTDVGGSGLVETVEQVLTVGRDAAVVVLSSAGDKALVAQGVRAGAVGSLDRTASPGETITALHVYKRHQLGEAVDMALAEPPPQTTGLRVSGALPRFPTADDESDRGILVGAEETADPVLSLQELPAEPMADLGEPVEIEEPAAPVEEPPYVPAAVDIWGAESEQAWGAKVDEPVVEPEGKRGLKRLLFRGGKNTR
jgi:DNA-binding NarL/FixJ family response regulator